MTDVSLPTSSKDVAPLKEQDPSAAIRDELLESYKQVLLCVFVATVILVVTLAISLLIPWPERKVLVFVALAGALGAFFSALMRLYNFEDLPKALLTGGPQLPKLYLFMYALIPPIVGAVAATALYLVFASKFVEGTLFPVFDCLKVTKEPCTSFNDFLNEFGPNGASEYAKALIWGFIAGFSERLVPDLFERSKALVSIKK